MSENTFYLTTPIYYVNARPHIGHAYSTIVADVLARRHRLLGEETYFLTGTDEHGQKIERSAAAAGIPPQQFADQVSKTFADLWARMGITHDQFIRTTDPKHKLGAQQLFRTLYEKGFIKLGRYTGAYCVSDEAFVDLPVGIPCPDCGRILEEVTEENFFFELSAFQEKLIDLIESNELLITPESARNEVLAFLQGYAASLSRQSKQSENPELRKIALEAIERFLETGILRRLPNGTLCDSATRLKDLSISRSSFTWGIPVPDDIQQAAGAKEKHVIYVWLDALANYITALGYGSEDTTLFDKFWPADIHLVGKEITRFHCVYWPAFLLAAGLPTPKQVTANGWLLFDNSKMSKSKGNVVRTETILDAFGTLCPPPLASNETGISPSGRSSGLQATESVPSNEGALAPGLSTPATNSVILSGAQSAESKDPDTSNPATTAGTIQPQTVLLKGSASAVPQTAPKNQTALAAEGALQPTPHDRDLFAADVLRYYLLREIPFGQDGSFSFDSLITRYNADLANGYGNLVSRTLNLIQQNQNGVVTEVEKPWLCVRTLEIPSKKIDVNSTEEIVFYIQQAADASKDMRVAGYVERFAGPVESMTQAISFRIALVDAYLTANAPWKLAKSSEPSDRQRMEEVLYTAAESIRIITALLYPILPYATARVWQQLGRGDIEADAKAGKLKDLQWGGLQPGTRLGPLGPIFPRADKGLAQTMIDNEEKLATPNPQTATDTTDPAAPPRTSSLPEPSGTLTVGGSTAQTTGPSNTPSHTQAQASGIFASAPSGPSTLNPEPSPQITIDDFAKIELRVAQITLAERIPKADKLLRLEVDLGPHGTRQILSGIAEFYPPEELTGRRIVVITNLAPRKMRGLESHGMLLAASDGDHGKPYLATCGDEIALGSRLK
jgi:methionyl-tRNA synthetase